MDLFYKFLKHLVIIFSIGLIGYWLLWKTLHMLNPIEKVWLDFKFSDIYFGHFQEKQLDEEIYFIDVGVNNNNLTRQQISEFITAINENHKPKVIGVDVDFKIDNSVSDEITNQLINSLNEDNIVLCYELKKVQNKWIKNTSELPIDYSQVKAGYTNNLIAAKGVDFGVERFFKPFLIEGDDSLKHFSIAIAEKMGIDVNSLLKKNNKVMINFQYTYNDPISIGDVDNYYKLKDKIVIVGLFTKNKEGNPLYNEDVHYTPSNNYYFGKSPPNMYGGEIMASIISSITNNTFIKYYKYFSKWLNIVLSFVLYFVLLYFLGKSHNIFIATTIIQQFGLVTLLMLASIFFVWIYNVYIDLTILALIAFFSVEFVGVIDEIIHVIEPRVKKLFNKFIKISKS